MADLNESLNIVGRESTLVTFGEPRAGASSDCGAWRMRGRREVVDVLED